MNFHKIQDFFLRAQRIGLTFVLSILFLNVSAQFNFLVGYNAGYYLDHSANEIFEEYNLQSDWLKTELENIDLQHGLQIGIRYGWKGVRMGLSYKNMGSRYEAEGIPPSSSESFRRQIKLRSNVFGVSLETNSHRINFGATLEYSLDRISGEISTLSNDYDIQSNTAYYAQFFLSFDFHGDQMIGLNIRPYWSLALSNYDLNPLASELSSTLSSTMESSQIGITILLVNGPRY